MNIIKGIDLIDHTEDYDAILVGTNYYCNMSNGFQSKIRYKYPHVYDINLKTPYGDTRKLGKRLTIYSNDGKTPDISLMYICHYKRKDRMFLDYDALKKSLMAANAEFRGKKVATTVLGSTEFDGNGDKERIIGIIDECTKDIDLDVYDYDQMDYNDEAKEILIRLYEENNDDGVFTMPVSEREKILNGKYLPLIKFKKIWVE